MKVREPNGQTATYTVSGVASGSDGEETQCRGGGSGGGSGSGVRSHALLRYFL